MTDEEKLKQEMEAARPDFEAMPDEPEFLKSRKWFGAEVDEDFLDFADPYKPPRYTLERKSVPFANIGELHVISGKAGHGKTNLMSMLMATILSGQQGNTRYREGIPEPVILYVDTEMGKDDTIAVKNRVCTLAGIPYDRQNEQFYILRLRDTELAEDRWRKTLKALWIVKERLKEGQCLHLFLDGMLDIVDDYNDQKECQPIIRECMMTATEFDTSMWIVQHENPLVDKLVGTLGSILQRKVSEIFTVRKIIQSRLNMKDRRPDRPEIYFTVEQLKARGRDIENWDFEVTSDSGWGMPREIYDSGEGFDPARNKENQERIEADEYFKGYDWPKNGTTYTALEDYLRSRGVTSNRQIKKLFDTAREAAIIFKNDKGKYFYRGIFGKEVNDETKSIPFDGKTSDECPF